ncbi:hypothetical protein RZS08_56065, partial [Arthrospira platensis SPKY1]|nr:hypothetical protein [Arthrospira platensis SPKY1]
SRRACCRPCSSPRSFSSSSLPLGPSLARRAGPGSALRSEPCRRARRRPRRHTSQLDLAHQHPQHREQAGAHHVVRHRIGQRHLGDDVDQTQRHLQRQQAGE